MKIKKVLTKEIILYLVFGILTTILNFVAFKIFFNLLGKGTHLTANALAFILAVVFAYITNKLFVFESKSWSFQVLKKEMPSFLGVRLLSFFFEEAGLFIAIDYYSLHNFTLFRLEGEFIIKVLLSVVVVILNYIFSKFLIFNFKTENKEGENNDV